MALKALLFTRQWCGVTLGKRAVTVHTSLMETRGQTVPAQSLQRSA